MKDILTLTIFFFLNLVVDGNELARGFNDDINWVNQEEGERLSREQNKPIMMLIHKSWCGACKALKPEFATSKEIEELSKSFVMVNIMDDEEPKDAKYTPDGGYIPRILFIDPSGTVLKDIINEGGNVNYKYFYSTPQRIVDSMLKCIKTMQDFKAGLDEL